MVRLMAACGQTVRAGQVGAKCVRALGAFAGFAAALTFAARPLSAADAAPDLSPSFDKDVRPVLAENCIGCHNTEKKKGDLDLSRFSAEAKIKGNEEVWQDVAERLRNRDMPPKKAKRKPTEQERKAILVWIREHVEAAEPDCSKIATDKNSRYYRGYVMSRRLTRAEYDNTIRDLVGIEMHLDDLLPSDGAGGEGFDTDGDALFTSAISLEKYLQAADKVLRAALPDQPGPLPADIRAAHDRIMIAAPGGADLPAREAARRVIDAFARRAFRRPVEPAEIDRLLTLFDRAQGRGQSYEASVRFALKGVLISPNFLFLVEPEPEQDGVYRLGDYQLASRVSYFLWSSMPDEELLALAAAGRLHEDDVLRQQVRRMLRDPRSIALAQNFGAQWLGITQLGVSTRPDAGRFPQFDDELCGAERQEVVLFLDSVIREDRSLLELIDGRYTFVNQQLADLYGIPDVRGGTMRRVALSADQARGGVLGMAAVLTATSYPLRTSPVLRGKWVLEQLLGERVPPPPPTAGKLPADDHQTGGLTFRQRLEQHRSNPECASCHARMDPIGFGLENFDAIGRWRSTQGGEPVDASGVLPDGAKFDGPRQLRAVLLKRKAQFLHNFSRKLLGYALGRGLGKFDDCVIKDAVAALAASDDRPSALFETIVLSKPFQYRYAKR